MASADSAVVHCHTAVLADLGHLASAIRRLAAPSRRRPLRHPGVRVSRARERCRQRVTPFGLSLAQVTNTPTPVATPL